MGASCWDYVAPYREDLGEVLAAARAATLADHAYYYADSDNGWPVSLEDLYSDEDVHESGTHSVIDIFRVIGPDDEDAFGTLRPLRPEEISRELGTLTPTREAFDKAWNGGGGPLGRIGPRWSGFSMVLYDQGSPSEIAIWGFSGD